MTVAYHGSPDEITVLRAGSYVTDDPRIAYCYGFQRAKETKNSSPIKVYKVDTEATFRQAAEEEGDFLVAVTESALAVDLHA